VNNRLFFQRQWKIRNSLHENIILHILTFVTCELILFKIVTPHSKQYI
jgi:hypothetical protein